MCHKIILTATYMQLWRLQESGAVCILTETPLSLSFWVHAHGTFLPILVTFWDPIWLPKLPSIFPPSIQPKFHWVRAEKFLPSSPGTVGWEAHGTFLPISVAFWGADLAAKTSKHLSKGFRKLPSDGPKHIACTSVQIS